MNNYFLELYNHQKLNISRPIYVKRMSAHRFEDLICTNKLERVLSGKRFLNEKKTTFFKTAKSLIWESLFRTKN